ncbi:MAG: chromosomal replication initiator protein DnaA [Bacteroidaceae bacterium]|nr:chromosomal replication initiator protein DnaA [Bacteroidaceae bacterium]
MTQQDEYKLKWQCCLKFIKNNLKDDHYKTWFEPLSFYTYNSQTCELVINAPSSYFSEHIRAHFSALTYVALRKEYGNTVKLYFRQLTDSENNLTSEVESAPVSPAKNVPQHPANQAPTTLQSHAPSPEFDSHLIDEYSFENFIEGTSNVLPRSVGMSIATNPKQMTFNPLFIFGHSGVGKTHLVNAIGHAIKELQPEKRVLYLSAHLFQVQYIDSCIKKTVNDFIRFYQQIDVLIIDDVQEFASHTSTQDTFFHIFNHLKANGKHIILTCDRPPTELQGMHDRLITRFKWGLLAELQQPDETLRRGILVNKVHRNGLHIPNDVIEYITQNVTESVRELEGVLNSLMAHSIVYNCDVDINMARRVVGHAVNVENKPITIDQILEHACEKSNVSKEDIFSSTRKASVVQARQIAMYLAQKHTNLSTSKIGALIGQRNHTTVIHSVRSITDRITTDKKLNDLVSEIEASLKR